MDDTVFFDFRGHTVRVVGFDGSPWFVAADVCRTLSVSRYGRQFGEFGEEELRTIDRKHAIGVQVLGRTRAPRLLLISESGLHRLLMRWAKPEARAFQEWVVRHVRPMI